MRKKIGRVCLLFGALCIFAAAALFLQNRAAERLAAEKTEEALSPLSEIIFERRDALEAEAKEVYPDAGGSPLIGHDPDIGAEWNGRRYLGVLFFPSLGQEMPVLADWNFDALTEAPARYYGSLSGGDLVLAAHNYPAHFGALFSLSIGDAVVLTDANGDIHRYTVDKIEKLLPDQKAEMLSGEWDLTLFSCNYEVTHRYTVRCKAE